MANQTTGGSSGVSGGGGDGADDIKAQLDILKADLAELRDTVSAQAKKKIDEAQERAAEKLEDLEEQIRRKPLQSAAIAAGIGFLLGAILSR